MGYLENESIPRIGCLGWLGWAALGLAWYFFPKQIHYYAIQSFIFLDHWLAIKSLPPLISYAIFFGLLFFSYQFWLEDQKYLSGILKYRACLILPIYLGLIVFFH